MSAKIPPTGASQQRHGIKKQFKAYLAHHQLVAVQTLLKIISKPAASLLTLLVIAIALTLPGALWMTLDNLQQLSGRFEQSGRMTLYLEKQTSEADGRSLAETLGDWSQVKKTKFINAKQALEEFKQYSGLEDALTFLDENPLPAIIVVEPLLASSEEELNHLITELKELNAVKQLQVDMNWVKKLLSMLALGERIVMVLGCLLSLAIFLVVGNTIRLAIAARVDEIRVVKLVGGTTAYVRRPFLYTGLWYGLLGGLLSWVLLALCWAFVNGPVEALAELYGASFTLKPLAVSAALILLLVAMLLSLIGAWWSVSRHIHEIEPKA